MTEEDYKLESNNKSRWFLFKRSFSKFHSRVSPIRKVSRHTPHFRHGFCWKLYRVLLNLALVNRLLVNHEVNQIIVSCNIS